MTTRTWPIETEDQIEALAQECEWNNRRFMSAKDYSIWCERMRKFARLAQVDIPTAADCEYCIDGLQADGETPCPCRGVHPPAPEAKEWRCFHCDEVFTDEHSAKLHFGMDQCKDPACKIKMGAETSLLVALRKAEQELQDAWMAIHDEATEAAKAYYAQQSRHGEQLRVAEELGFERGIADSTKHIAALEQQALEHRRLCDEAQHDALLWRYSISSEEHPPLLTTVWRQRQEALLRAVSAENALKAMQKPTLAVASPSQ